MTHTVIDVELIEIDFGKRRRRPIHPIERLNEIESSHDSFHWEVITCFVNSL